MYQDAVPAGGLGKRDRSDSDADITPFASSIGSFGGSDRELSRIGLVVLRAVVFFLLEDE